MDKMQFIKRYIRSASGPQWHTVFEGSKTIADKSSTVRELVADISNLKLKVGDVIRYRISMNGWNTRDNTSPATFSITPYGTNTSRIGYVGTSFDIVAEGDWEVTDGSQQVLLSAIAGDGGYIYLNNTTEAYMMYLNGSSLGHASFTLVKLEIYK